MSDVLYVLCCLILTTEKSDYSENVHHISSVNMNSYTVGKWKTTKFKHFLYLRTQKSVHVNYLRFSLSGSGYLVVGR